LLGFLHESDGIARFAAAEAFVVALVGADVKGRAFLGVEGQRPLSWLPALRNVTTRETTSAMLARNFRSRTLEDLITGMELVWRRERPLRKKALSTGPLCCQVRRFAV